MPNNQQTKKKRDKIFNVWADFLSSNRMINADDYVWWCESNNLETKKQKTKNNINFRLTTNFFCSQISICLMMTSIVPNQIWQLWKNQKFSNWKIWYSQTHTLLEYLPKKQKDGFENFRLLKNSNEKKITRFEIKHRKSIKSINQSN